MNLTATRSTPVITAWGAISPFGIGDVAFRTGMAARTAPRSAVSGDEPSAGGQASLIEEFDIRGVLGPKKTRSMDRLTALTVATVGQLVDPEERADRPSQAHAGLDGPTTPGRALVLGTTTGSAQSMMDFTRSSLTGDKPYHVDPARFPNTVMNCAAGRAAIWHQLTGPNATIGGGRAAGILALNYARRLQAAGRAGSVLCGAAEEYSRARAWLHGRAHAVAEPEVLGEGCAMVLLERDAAAADRGLADVLAVQLGVYDQVGDAGAALASCVRKALSAAAVSAADVWACASSGIAGELGAAEDAAVDEVLGGVAAERLHCADLIGDTAAAAAMFQLVAVLAKAESEPSDAARVALVTSVDWDGVVGAAVVSVRPSAAG